MEISQSAKEKIKEMEGLRLTAYKCPAGVVTVGYGHTGPGVSPGQVITQHEADALLEGDLRSALSSVERAVSPANLRQCQYDALVSFVYNVGAGAFRRSTLLKKIKSNPDNPAIRDEFRKWVNGGGKRLPGLVKRREWEARRYFGEV